MFMERRKKSPERYYELRDPKLPAIHGTTCGNRAENHVCPGPIPAQEIEPLRHES